MSKKLHWTYHNSNSTRLGSMICATCGKAIDSGMYRCRDAGDRYVTHHKSCSLSDPKWAELDGENQKYMAHLQERLSATIAFRDKWEMHILDDEIDAMRETLLQSAPQPSSEALQFRSSGEDSGV